MTSPALFRYLFITVFAFFIFMISIIVSDNYVSFHNESKKNEFSEANHLKELNNALSHELASNQFHLEKLHDTKNKYKEKYLAIVNEAQKENRPQEQINFTAFDDFMMHIKKDLKKNPKISIEKNKIFYPMEVFFQYRDVHIKDVGTQNLQKLSKIIQKHSKILAPYHHWGISIEIPVNSAAVNPSVFEAESLMAFQKTYFISENLIALGFPPHRITSITHFDQKNIDLEDTQQKVVFKIYTD